jgi:hypothetical protein
MSLEAQIQLITVPQEFTRLCNAALAAEYGDDYLPIGGLFVARSRRRPTPPGPCRSARPEAFAVLRARTELEATDRILAERRELAVFAARISPPTYIIKELGERPRDPGKRRGWEAGVRTIEGYRQEQWRQGRRPRLRPRHDSSRSAARAREQAQRRLRNAQRELGRINEAPRARDMGY